MIRQLICEVWIDTHECGEPLDHAGDHRCAGCGDVWNRTPDDDDQDEWEHERPPVEERCTTAAAVSS